MASGPTVYRETRQLDEIAYEITVRAIATGYYGAWHCPLCARGDVNVLMANAEQDALDMAREGADAHHREVHTPSESS